MKTRITLSLARLLQQVMVAEVNRGEFRSSRSVLDTFIKDGVLDYRMIGTQHQKVFCPDVPNLVLYLQNKHGIPSLEDYILFLESSDGERSDAVKVSSDSKIRSRKIFQGFLVNSYEPIVAEINGVQFKISPTRGTFVFISAFESFRIPDGVTVVVVENFENFREIERQRYLFPAIVPLFVWRYQNTIDIAEWLNSTSAPYLHFGDFDLKGIHIFLSEFKSRLKDSRGRFFIPDHIEELLVSNGSRSLYEDQKSIIPSLMNYEIDHELADLLAMIRSHKKGLSQEILIE